MTPFIGLWTVLVLLVVLNGFAAGIAALLHVWRRGRPLRSRILIAAVAAGLVPAAIALPPMAIDMSVGAIAPLGLIIGIVVSCGIAMAASLPGALIIARKLEAPGDEYRTFE